MATHTTWHSGDKRLQGHRDQPTTPSTRGGATLFPQGEVILMIVVTMPVTCHFHTLYPISVTAPLPHTTYHTTCSYRVRPSNLHWVGNAMGWVAGLGGPPCLSHRLCGSRHGGGGPGGPSEPKELLTPPRIKGQSWSSAQGLLPCHRHLERKQK
jgi:hypothetical protein